MIWDISPPLEEGIFVWPGDTPYTVTENLAKRRGDAVDLSDIRLSCHTGAHADAPRHTQKRDVGGGPVGIDAVGIDAVGIDAVGLDAYLGPCSVHDVRPADGIVQVADLEASGIRPLERVLLRTRDQPVDNPLIAGFTSLAVELIEWLARAGTRLVGLDTPSVDRFESTSLPTHAALWHHGLANLESLDLSDVPPGHYELIALPLRLVDRDASPVRAILRTLRTS